jgi:N-acetylglucosaminyldiphosphoundecaprenol N-acetyl-beta-D-mannosaminyltransferase
MSVKMFGVKISKKSKSQIEDFLVDSLRGGTLIRISKINTEFLDRAVIDSGFRDVLNNCDLNIVDGRGVLWAARYLTLPTSDVKIVRFFNSIWQVLYSLPLIVLYPKYVTKPIPNTIPGIEALNLMLSVAENENAGVFIFGSSQNNLELAIHNLKKDFPRLEISGSLNGYDYQSDLRIDVVESINTSGAKLLIVALGSPKQEYWISENAKNLKNIRVAVGEGGTLDRIAKPIQKTPEFINKIGLEWLWRLMFNKSKTETRNRLQRFWRAVPGFIFQTVKWKVKHGQTKI